jgi:hypothetical protein
MQEHISSTVSVCFEWQHTHAIYPCMMQNASYAFQPMPLHQQDASNEVGCSRPCLIYRLDTLQSVPMKGMQEGHMDLSFSNMHDQFIVAQRSNLSIWTPHGES